MKINANLIKVGNILNYKNRHLQVLNTNIIKPGKGGAFIQVEMKDIKDGTKFNERWRTSDNVDKAKIEEADATFLYKDAEKFTIMNNSNFEQTTCSNQLIEKVKLSLLEEGMSIKLIIVEQEIININLPKNIKVKILTADPVVKVQTASSSYKNAETTRNIKLLVPPHIKEDDDIIINSENLEYVEKAKD